MNDKRSLKQCDKDADAAIDVMMYGIGALSLLPVALNWTLAATAMGAGTVAIGRAYGMTLEKEDGAKLVMQFIKSAGLMFLCLHVGAKIGAAIIQFTGVGYLHGVALDAVMSGTFAWAIGKTAKSYFRAEYKGEKLTNRELGEIFRQAFKERKKEAVRKNESTEQIETKQESEI